MDICAIIRPVHREGVHVISALSVPVVLLQWLPGRVVLRSDVDEGSSVRAHEPLMDRGGDEVRLDGSHRKGDQVRIIDYYHIWTYVL